MNRQAEPWKWIGTWISRELRLSPNVDFWRQQWILGSLR